MNNTLIYVVGRRGQSSDFSVDFMAFITMATSDGAAGQTHKCSPWLSCLVSDLLQWHVSKNSQFLPAAQRLRLANANIPLSRLASFIFLRKVGAEYFDQILKHIFRS